MKFSFNHVVAPIVIALAMGASQVWAQTFANLPTESPTGGPAVQVQGGDRKFFIPKGYFRSRMPGYGNKERWWLEVLWPDMSPWRTGSPSDDKEFHAPGGGRMIKINIEFEFSKPNLNHLRYLNRLVGEYVLEDLQYALNSFPDGSLQNRRKGNSLYGLLPYYVNYDNVLIFLNRNRLVPLPALSEDDIYRFDDWYIRRDDKENVITYIRCHTRDMPDPPDASITGKVIIRVPHCNHRIQLLQYDAAVTIHYRRIYLPEWQAIENAVRALITQFESPKP